MLISYKRGQGSIILRVKILDSAVSTGAGKTGLGFNTAGLIISTITDKEAAATVYTVAANNVENITTLGTFAAPSANKCRFKEVDATNHKGVYELQIADARYAVTGAKSLLISISGATGAADCDCIVPLTDLDPYDGVRAGLSIFSGVTALGNWLRALARKSAPDATALSEINAGGGDFDSTTDSEQAIRDNMTAAAASVTILPLSVTVSAGVVSTNDLTAYQFAGFTFTFAIVDSAGQPKNLSGKTIKFVAYAIDDASTLRFELATPANITITGASNNQVTVVSTHANTLTAEVVRWVMRNMTDDEVIGHGSLTIEPKKDASP